MPVRTKRWNDPVEPEDGLRVLICRYRPRGVSAQDATWTAWCPSLAPSRQLHAEAYGKHGPPLTPEAYERQFLAEMQAQAFWLTGFAKSVAAGETITFLCSSACTDEARCHRTLVKRLVEDAARDLSMKVPTFRRRA